MRIVEYDNQVDNLVFKIFKIFDIFYGSSYVSSEESIPLVLFILSMYKDGLIKAESFNNHDSMDEFKDTLDLLSKGATENIDYQPVVKILIEGLSKINEQSFNRICNTLSELDSVFLKENFAEVFDNILYRVSQSQGRNAGEFIQPKELTRFMCGLFDLKDDAKVFNPFAGLASFAVYGEQDQDYYGQELNQKTWALGALRLMAYEIQGRSRYVCNDSLLNWPDGSQKFDLIVSNPPYGLRLGNQYRDIEPGIRTPEQFLVEKGMRSLNKEGKLIALLPQGFLFRGMQGQQLRQFLVDEDILDTIISLPGGLLSNIGIPLIILIINKKKERPGKVRFIKADRFIESRSPREKFLNDHALSGLIHGSNADEDAIRIIDIAQIKVWDYNLNVPRYFQKEIALANNEHLVKLKDIVEFVRGQRGDLPENGKLVRIRDLRDDKVDFHLNVSEIEDVELRRPDIHQVNETCLLLAIRWRTLKPTYFVFEGISIYRSQDILSFKVNESVADYRFLINELHADYVQEQLESYRMGSTVPFMRRDDLLEVAIKLPSLQEQKAKVQGIFELSNEIRILQEKLNTSLVNESASLYVKESSLKHRLGTPLLNIGSSLRNFEKALSREFVSWEETKLNERYNITLRESFDSIYQTLKTVHQILIANENEIDFSNKRLEEIDFLAFVKGYVNRIKSAEKSNVSTKLDIHPDIKIQLKNKIFILANTELLEIGLNAIVENANMHAFTDDSKKYKLEFRVSLYVSPRIEQKSDDTISRFDTYIKIEVANNGKPFPENYTLEKLIRKNSFAGETGNTGQGGFDLNEIIKYLNNGRTTLELVTDDFTTEFTSTYSFLIPFNR